MVNDTLFAGWCTTRPIPSAMQHVAPMLAWLAGRSYRFHASTTQLVESKRKRIVILINFFFDAVFRCAPTIFKHTFCALAMAY